MKNGWNWWTSPRELANEAWRPIGRPFAPGAGAPGLNPTVSIPFLEFGIGLSWCVAYIFDLQSRHLLSPRIVLTAIAWTEHRYRYSVRSLNGRGAQLTKPSTLSGSPKSEPALEIHRRAAPCVEAHHRVSGPITGRNSRGRRIKKENLQVWRMTKFGGHEQGFWFLGVSSLTSSHLAFFLAECNGLEHFVLGALILWQAHCGGTVCIFTHPHNNE